MREALHRPRVARMLFGGWIASKTCDAAGLSSNSGSSFSTNALSVAKVPAALFLRSALLDRNSKPPHSLSPETKCLSGHEIRESHTKNHQKLQTAPQVIAALGDPGATSGNGAQSWGFWNQDRARALASWTTTIN